jgi:ABC-type multidrug transport system fused ATPase/permease subunit
MQPKNERICCHIFNNLIVACDCSSRRLEECILLHNSLAICQKKTCTSLNERGNFSFHVSNQFKLKSAVNMQLLNLAVDILYKAIPIFIAMGVFAVFKLEGGTLTADAAFPTISYLHLMVDPLMGVPALVVTMVTARVSLSRVQKFVNAAEATGTFFLHTHRSS